MVLFFTHATPPHMIIQERSLKSSGFLRNLFGNVNGTVTCDFVWKTNSSNVFIKRDNWRKKVVYKMNWYKKPYMLETVRRIWVTTWLTKYSNVNYEKNDESGSKGLPRDFMANIRHRIAMFDFCWLHICSFANNENQNHKSNLIFGNNCWWYMCFYVTRNQIIIDEIY